MIAAVIRAAVTATRESGGFDALMVTALATVALAAVGIISIVTNYFLVRAAWRQTNTAAAAVELQRQELETLQAQLDLTREEMNLRSASTAAERERAELGSRVNLELNASGGSYQGGSPPHNVEIVVVVTNHGPGVANGLTYGIARGDWEAASHGQPRTLGIEGTVRASISVPDGVVANTTSLGRSNFIEEEFTAWARYADATGARWEKRGSADAMRRRDES